MAKKGIAPGLGGARTKTTSKVMRGGRGIKAAGVAAGQQTVKPVSGSPAPKPPLPNPAGATGGAMRVPASHKFYNGGLRRGGFGSGSGGGAGSML